MITERGLSKEERIHGKNNVNDLFQRGAAFLTYPFRCIYTFSEPLEERIPLRVMVSVGRRYHKRAVKRNIIKRRAREAYRLNKKAYYDGSLPLCIDICFVYVGAKEESYEVVEKGIKKALEKVATLCRKEHIIISKSKESLAE